MAQNKITPPLKPLAPLPIRVVRLHAKLVIATRNALGRAGIAGGKIVKA